MAAYRRVCGFDLTAEDRDQLRNPTLVSSTGLPYALKLHQRSDAVGWLNDINSIQSIKNPASAIYIGVL